MLALPNPLGTPLSPPQLKKDKQKRNITEVFSFFLYDSDEGNSVRSTPHVAPSPPSLKIFWLRLWAPTSFSGLGPKSKSRCGSNFGFYIVIIKTVAFNAIFTNTGSVETNFKQNTGK